MVHITQSEYLRYIKLIEENEKLRRFARYIIKSAWRECSLDGGDVQDFAEQCGLISKKIAEESDVKSNSNFEKGDSIFIFSDTLKGAE